MFTKDPSQFDYIQKFIDYLKQIIKIILELFGKVSEDASK